MFSVFDVPQKKTTQHFCAFCVEKVYIIVLVVVVDVADGKYK